MKNYQQIDTLIKDFYTHKDSVETFLKTADIFDIESKKQYFSAKQQCLSSLSGIFSLVQQDSINTNIRLIAIELEQTLSLVKTPDDLSWTHLLSCATFLQLIQNELSLVLENKQPNSQNVYTPKFTLLTKSFRDYIGMPMEFCSLSSAQLFLQPYRYTVMDVKQLYVLVREIDVIIPASLFAHEEFKQSSYGRFPGFLIKLKDVVSGVIRKKENASKKKLPPFSRQQKVDTPSSLESHSKQPFSKSVESSPTPIENHDEDDNDIYEKKTIQRQNYLDTLTTDRESILSSLDIDEEVTQDTYEDVLAGHEDNILLLKDTQEFQKLLNTRVRVYKSYVTRTDSKQWMGEAMIFLQKIFTPKVHEKKLEEYSADKTIFEDDDIGHRNVDEFPRYRKNIAKRKEERLALLRRQSVYFPQIIALLQQFKQQFTAEHPFESPEKFRVDFVQQYDLLVVQPVIQLDPELFKMDNHDLSDYKHRISELYKGIPSLIGKGSDALIETGVKKGFIFGEIDDLIDQLQKMYDEHNS